LTTQPRSVMAMMIFMAWGVKVPLEQRQGGRAIDYGLENGNGEIGKRLIPFRMQATKSRPQHVFAAVRFNGYWYYIDTC